MDIFKFIGKLLPSVERNNVIDALRTLKKELEEQTIPTYQQAFDAGVFQSTAKFKSKWAQDFQVLFTNGTRNLRVRGNYVEGSLTVLKTLPARIDWLIEQFEKKTDQTIVANGITFPVANLMQFHQAVDFVVKFSRKVLLMTYINETSDYFKQRNIDTPFTPADIKEINGALSDYVRTLAVVAHPDIVKTLNSVPDVVVEGSDQAGTVGAYGNARLQPLGFTSAYHMNPIYMVRQWIADLQVARYEEAKAERAALELFLIQLQQAQQGKEDAAVQKQIEYHNGRLQRLSLQIAKMEEDLE